MQAYAAAERPSSSDNFRSLDRASAVPADTLADQEQALFDHILGRLADLVVDRLVERTEAHSGEQAIWLDARSAAVGIHRDTLRKLAAQRAIPTHQDGPGCRLYFRRDELDEWRRSAPPMRGSAGLLRAVS